MHQNNRGVNGIMIYLLYFYMVCFVLVLGFFVMLYTLRPDSLETKDFKFMALSLIICPITVLMLIHMWYKDDKKQKRKIALYKKVKRKRK